MNIHVLAEPFVLTVSESYLSLMFLERVSLVKLSVLLSPENWSHGDNVWRCCEAEEAVEKSNWEKGICDKEDWGT